ncbi:hypothetical protein ABV409_12845 [Flagellimonas sp. DF-77]|uniref:hypothetical protein n=1 Tax=Flagellimonas algarum TaxID=3230298 RepID=UPI0033988F7D
MKNSKQLKTNANFEPLYLNLDVTKKVDAYQIIYASQLYGTFFAIGARFELNDDCSEIEGIELTLNNYRGLYNIGMHYNTANNWETKGDIGVLKLQLMAYNGTDNDDLVKKLTMNLSENIPLSDIKGIFTTRDLISFTKADPIEDHLDEPTFDSEYFERNGRYIKRKKRLDSVLPDDPDQIDLKNVPEIADPQGNCMNTLAILIK